MDNTDFIANPEILVGQKVSVLFHKNNRWYYGTVKSYDSKQKSTKSNMMIGAIGSIK